jgi:hypothetical protein
MKKILACAALFLATMAFTSDAWADISEATFTPQGASVYPSVDVTGIAVYSFRPDFKFTVIGVIDAHGMAGGANSIFDSLLLKNLLREQPGEKEDMELAIRALKIRAAEAGADAVIIMQSNQVRVSETATERRIRAAAIRRED